MDAPYSLPPWWPLQLSFMCSLMVSISVLASSSSWRLATPIATS